VGLAVGESVGLAVGESVGLTVGESVGLAVGDTVGRGVVHTVSIQVLLTQSRGKIHFLPSSHAWQNSPPQSMSVSPRDVSNTPELQ
jgi:hypothetical protein